MSLDKGVNELNGTPRTNWAAQIAGRQLPCRDSTARTKPIAANGVRLTAVSGHNIAWCARLCDVALSQTLLQLLRETHAPASALQLTFG
jgi:hypothetical protein